MKKTMSRIVIVLTMCLATACSSSAKKEEMAAQTASAPASAAVQVASPTSAPVEHNLTKEEQMAKQREIAEDQLSQKYTRDLWYCTNAILEKEVFNHATTTALHSKISKEARNKCRILAQAGHFRECELNPRPSCAMTGQELDIYIEYEIDLFIHIDIDDFDKNRAIKGLPPRPSYGK